MSKCIPIFLGVLPPPLTGAAYANNCLLKRLGLTFYKLNTSPISLEDMFFRKYKRIKRIFFCILLLSLVKDFSYSYYFISLNGRLGLFYDLFFLFFLRSKRPICLHHNFNYILKYSFLMHTVSLLIRLLQGTHVFLSDDMRDKYFCRYYKADSTTISNSAFVRKQTPYVYRKDRKAVGFLSNLTKEKGIFLFYELFLLCQRKNMTFVFHLAGPCVDKDALAKINKAQSISDCLIYYNFLNQKRKTAFFRKLNFFIFPSFYKNEAEPLVVLEAMSFGIPVFAMRTGLVADMINNNFLLCDKESFAGQVCEKLLYLQANEDEYIRISKEMFFRFHQLKCKSIKNINLLRKKFCPTF